MICIPSFIITGSAEVNSGEFTDVKRAKEAKNKSRLMSIMLSVCL
jgi:hypothetical protein